jgi:hypothetical protein
MASTKNEGSSAGRTWAVVIGVGLLAIVAIGVWRWSHQPPPQIGADPEVFTTVNALFTALTGQDEHQRNACETRLHAYRAEGRLPAAAAETLDSIVAQSRAGDWQPAAQRLYKFMYGQTGAALVASEAR